MLNFLLFFNIFLAVVLLVGVVLMLRATLEMRKAIKLMDDRLGKLDARLAMQQKQVDDLRRMLAEQPDALHSIMNHLSGWKKNGPLKTFVALGSSLFGAYFKQKRTKALPARVDSKDQK
ncbi:MAG: hypothetical protein ACKVQS_05330 [Fimbriimonadaceae bacterium]